MNEKAVALSELIDGFERVAREHIRVAGGAHAAAVRAEADHQAAEQVRRDAAETALNELAMDAHRGAVPEIVTRPRLTVRLAPLAATGGNRLDPRHVADVQVQFPPNEHVRVKNDSDARQWWSCAIPIRREPHLNPETTWRMRLVRPGYLEYQATVGARIDDDPEILIDGRRLEASIVRTLERMAQIAGALGLDGPALAIIALALSHEPFLLVVTHLYADTGFNDSNTLTDRSRAVRSPLLARCDNVPPTPRPCRGARRRHPAIHPHRERRRRFRRPIGFRAARPAHHQRCTRVWRSAASPCTSSTSQGQPRSSTKLPGSIVAPTACGITCLVFRACHFVRAPERLRLGAHTVRPRPRPCVLFNRHTAGESTIKRPNLFFGSRAVAS
jgi:hypothetical protein